MPPARIIEAVNVVANGLGGVLAAGKAGAPDQLGFDRLEHRLHNHSRSNCPCRSLMERSHASPGAFDNRRNSTDCRDQNDGLR